MTYENRLVKTFFRRYGTTVTKFDLEKNRSKAGDEKGYIYNMHRNDRTKKMSTKWNCAKAGCEAKLLSNYFEDGVECFCRDGRGWTDDGLHVQHPPDPAQSP